MRSFNGGERWPGKKAGRALALRGKHFFALIFFGSFLDQAKKEQNLIKSTNSADRNAVLEHKQLALGELHL
jgi:hypothetical protein